MRILAPATGPAARNVEYGVYKVGWAAPLHMNGSIARVSFIPHVSGRLRGILRREQFDILHVHEPLASPLGLSVLHLGRMAGATLVGTFHAYAPRARFTSAPEWAYASAAPFLTRYFRMLHGRIAVSPAAEEFVSRFFPADYRIIPNGVDTQVYCPETPSIPQYDDDKLNVVYMGRIENRKGLKYLLRAIPMIREHVPNTRFLIGGDGPLRPGFERLVARAGWRDVVFMGRVPEELKRSLYTTADVFCAPNVGGESQGVVLLEALASGRAVVASDIAGFRSVIDHQSNGLLVPPKRSEELAWAVCHLLNDRAERRRLEVAARLRAEAFNWERVATQVLNFYEETRATRAVAESRLITADSATISLAE